MCLRFVLLGICKGEEDREKKRERKGGRERERTCLCLRIFGPTSIVLHARWMLAVDISRFRLASKKLVL